MKLGVDFGTTRIVVAAVDRGNYPLVSFETAEAMFEWFPPLVAMRGMERRFGWDAWHAQEDPSWTIIRSLKRYLEDAGPETLLEAQRHHRAARRSDAWAAARPSQRTRRQLRRGRKV